MFMIKTYKQNPIWYKIKIVNKNSPFILNNDITSSKIAPIIQEKIPQSQFTYTPDLMLMDFKVSIIAIN